MAIPHWLALGCSGGVELPTLADSACRNMWRAGTNQRRGDARPIGAPWSRLANMARRRRQFGGLDEDKTAAELLLSGHDRTSKQISAAELMGAEPTMR